MVRRFTKKVSEVEQPMRGFDDYQLCIGDVFRGERATKDKSLLDVQRDTRISAKYISAIENADLSVFQSPGYIPGYVKAYASYLGLNPDWAFECFCKESGFETFDSLSLTDNKLQKTRKKNRESIKNVNKNSSPTKFGSIDHNFLDQIEFRAFGSIGVLVVLIGALSFGGLSIFKQIQQVTYQPIDEVNIFSADLNPDRNRQDIKVSNNQIIEDIDQISEMDNFVSRAKVLNEPIFERRDPPIGELVKKRIVSEIRNELEIKKRNLNDYFDRPKLRPIVQVTERIDEKIIIFSLKPAYIRVSEKDGTILYSKILDPGEYFTVPQSDSSKSLRAGMSGHVYFRMDGKEYGPVGSGPNVERNINITRKDILDKFTLADFTKNPKAKKIIAKLNLNLTSDHVDLE